MSGTIPNTGHASLAAYRGKIVGTPFTLELDDGTTVTIPRPTSKQIRRAEQNPNDTEWIMESVCGEELAEQIFALIDDEDWAVMKMLTEDISRHFGLGG